MAVTLATLIEGNPELVTAREHDPVSEAMERMREHNFSQLPVVEGEGKAMRATGLLSTATISRASLYLDIAPSKLRVHHAVDRHPLRRNIDDELWRVLDDVRMGEVVLVEDDDGHLRGILTGQDFTSFLRRQTDAVITVQEIEVAIKQLIEDEYRGRQAELDKAVERELGVQRRDTEKSVRGILNRCLAAVEPKGITVNPTVFDEAFKKAFPDRAKYEFDRLTFSQYQNILLSDCWGPYKDEFELPIENLRVLLDTAREIRNQIMHNRGLPSAAERAKLSYCRELLNRIIDRRQEPAPTPVEVVSQPAAHEPVVSVGEPTLEGPEETTVASWKWLEDVDASEDRVTRTFAEIETLIAAKLPSTAREHRSWWTNAEDAPQAAQWLEVSWRVVSVNLTAQTATFGRNTSREEVLISIFGLMFKRLGENREWTYELPSPAGRSWQVLQRLAVQASSVSVVPGFTDGERFRISIYIDGPEAQASKAIFDMLANHRDELERAMMSPLVWERNPHRRASRVSLMYTDVSVRSSDEEIEKLAAWVGVNLPRLWAEVKRILAQP